MSKVNVTIAHEEPSETISIADIPVGTYFLGTISGYGEGVKLRTPTEVVVLDNPNITWDIAQAVEVENYRAGDIAVQFTVTSTATEQSIAPSRPKRVVPLP